ncbi:Predicted flavoprotein CzcO associated with the cation diffusion facilitator CzcD [Prauserella marina]|uniref:Predicted flavoprotein CzcO associated with the cation diffusion facilitator CzcD n=1 Tax=Prauserella marina TaxID=530584 RepID=A0A1G6IDV9_9PSEU|nr:NAD(P)-binding domain-containing protein [Prauserella marina]PWV85110.1 cation diffusion facilitator CzcD-associated flavoprotein CzcO [Prauserella marina]SDC04553.1 Predicted flavoprotein CzcO associated with the cation diffusion facilitator CzcD [Prauserella marina]
MTEVVVIGAGQAGLSAAYHLLKAGLTGASGFVVLDHGKRAGGAWQYRWPSLRLSKAHGIHDLPGMSLGPAEGDLPAADVVSAYFDRYERAFDLPVRRPVDVLSVRHAPDPGWFLVESTTESWLTRGILNATGTWDKPFWPRYPGQELFEGRQLHTADYQGAAEFSGRHVVVVGGGSSAVQQLLEIAPSAAGTTWVTRRPPVFRHEDFTPEYGREVVAKVDRRVREGRPPGSVVSVTGLMLTPEVRAAREAGVLHRLPMFSTLTPHGIRWADGTERRADVILWATGFRAALDHLAPLRLRGPGGGIRISGGGTRVADEPRLHLIGYGPSASTIGANRAGRVAVRELLDELR